MKTTVNCVSSATRGLSSKQKLQLERSGSNPLIGWQTHPRPHGIASGRIPTMLTTAVTVFNTGNGYFITADNRWHWFMDLSHKVSKKTLQFTAGSQSVWTGCNYSSANMNSATYATFHRYLIIVMLGHVRQRQYVRLFSSILFNDWGETDSRTQFGWKSSTSVTQ